MKPDFFLEQLVNRKSPAKIAKVIWKSRRMEITNFAKDRGKTELPQNYCIFLNLRLKKEFGYLSG